jgi:hypothetical protein
MMGERFLCDLFRRRRENVPVCVWGCCKVVGASLRSLPGRERGKKLRRFGGGTASDQLFDGQWPRRRSIGDVDPASPGTVSGITE